MSANAPRAIPVSTAAWMIWAAAPIGVGRSNAAWWSMTANGATSTSSNSTVPLAVVRWPKLDQSSMTVRPGASRSTNTMTTRPLSSLATVGTQWANAAPVA